MLKDHEQQIAVWGRVFPARYEMVKRMSRIKNTRVVGEPIKSIEPVLKRNIIIIFLSSTAGLLLGVMIALGAELIRETRKRIPEDKPDA